MEMEMNQWRSMIDGVVAVGWAFRVALGKFNDVQSMAVESGF